MASRGGGQGSTKIDKKTGAFFCRISRIKVMIKTNVNAYNKII